MNKDQRIWNSFVTVPILTDVQYLQTVVNTQVCIRKKFDYFMFLLLKCHKWHKISVLFLILSQSSSFLIFQIFSYILLFVK